MGDNRKRVVVMGASPKPERYSNRAVQQLLEHGHEVIPVHPAAEQIHGVPVLPDLAAVTGRIDSITMYVSPAISAKLEGDILDLCPDLVIFNPGTENAQLEQTLATAEIATLHACTLVLLGTNQFDSVHP